MNEPSQADIHAIVGLLNAGQADKAVAAAKRLADRFPKAATLHLLLGIALTGQGKLDPAIHNIRKSLKLKPDYPEALNNLGIALRKQGKLTEALEAYSAALRLLPTYIAAAQNASNIYNQLGNGHYRAGKYQDAIDVARKALVIEPGNATTLTILGASLVYLGRHEEASSYMQAAVEVAPDRINFLAYWALAARALGRPHIELLRRILDFESVQATDLSIQMWAALQLDLPKKAFSYRPGNLNVMNWDDLSKLYGRADLAAKFAALPKLEGSLPADNARPLLYAGGDGVYAERFARDLISSALEKCPDCDLHLHLMNPGNYDPRRALAGLPMDRITWTWEAMGPCDKILYSSRRFIRMAQIRHQIGRPVILVDTDSVINGNIIDALPAAFDVIVYDRPDEPWAHQMVNGGFLAVSAGGRDFLDFLAAYILHFEESGRAKWYDDQFGIVSARAWFARNVPGLSIQAAPPHMMDWKADHAPDSLIWHAKGDLKRK